MDGYIVSYVKEKKYGFVKGNDGESYFLHCSALKNKDDEKLLIKGATVSFEQQPTPKGLSAIKVIVIPSLKAMKLTPFFMTRNGNPKYGEIVVADSTQTKFYKNPEEAKYNLKLLTGAVGGNAILNLSVEKKTFTDGNYQYTMHSYFGKIALVFDEVAVSSIEEQDALNNEYADCIRRFELSKKNIFKEQKEIVDSQINKDNSGCLITSVIIFIFVLLTLL